jgi:hypothetical protein
MHCCTGSGCKQAQSLEPCTYKLTHKQIDNSELKWKNEINVKKPLSVPALAVS